MWNGWKEELDKVPSDILLMSRKHCHAKNVHSIVLNRGPDGELLRAFITDKQHELYKNSIGDDLAVGIHNHKYDLKLKLLFGEVRNDIYTAISQYRAIYYLRTGFELNHFEFKNDMSGKIEYKKVGVAKVSKEQDGVYLSEYCWYCLPNDIFHNIWVPRNSYSGWLVQESRQIRDITHLYTNSEDIDTSDLYEKFSSRDELYSFLDGLERRYLGDIMLR